jgi:hypothetical protein
MLFLKEYAISNRTFRAILENWKRDNFRYSIDWYLYDNLTRPALIISSSEAGQIFLFLKKRGMFFRIKVGSVESWPPNLWNLRYRRN